MIWHGCWLKVDKNCLMLFILSQKIDSKGLMEMIFLVLLFSLWKGLADEAIYYYKSQDKNEVVGDSQLF